MPKLPDAAARALQPLGLWLRYGLLLTTLTVTSVMTCALGYKFFLPYSMGFPAGFFEGITATVVGVTLLAGVIAWQRLRQGGVQRTALWLGGQPVPEDPQDALQRRLLNLVDDLVILEGQAVPAVYVLPHEPGINAIVLGSHRRDLALCVTQGALDRLNREELRALLAHAFGRLRDLGQAQALQRLALVWSLSWLHGLGQIWMHPGRRQRVSPLRWLGGLSLRAAGWLGWVAGRMLQAPSSRAAVRAADGTALQLVEQRQDFGNVLRKLLHDHHMMRGRMQHPCADMLAFLAFHDPVGMPGLATHPSLEGRVRHALGQAHAPLPTSALPVDASEPRRRLHSGLSGLSVHSLPGETLDAPVLTPEAQRQALIHADREALARMALRADPTETRLTILALMMDPGNRRELKLWHRLAMEATNPEALLADVSALLPTSRLPEFERLVGVAARHPLIHKRLLVEAARDLMRADGRVSPRERLWWMVLRHRLNDSGSPALMRPITGQGQGLQELSLLEKAYVNTLTGYVARFVPQETATGPVSDIGLAWWRAVMARLGEGEPLANNGQPPDTDALMHALAGVQELSWMVRPLLLSAWAEEALNHSPQGLLSDDTADALRLLASLLDAPLPPMLASHYPKAA
ncbi:MAG: hypothetical protein RI907_3655 [Pseudomonadota bacterium]